MQLCIVPVELVNELGLHSWMSHGRRFARAALITSLRPVAGSVGGVTGLTAGGVAMQRSRFALGSPMPLANVSYDGFFDETALCGLNTVKSASMSGSGPNGNGLSTTRCAVTPAVTRVSSWVPVVICGWSTLASL